MTNKQFTIEGDLWLYCQEGGLADDAFVLKEYDPRDNIEILAQIVTNLHLGSLGLDDAVATHFKAERIMPGGNRHIGQVRITIERIDDETNTFASSS